MFDATRHAWNAHSHAIKAYQTNMAIEAGTLFIELSLANISEDAERMQIQVDNAKPRKVEDPEPTLLVNPLDINGVFDWCFNNYLNRILASIDRILEQWLASLKI